MDTFKLISTTDVGAHETASSWLVCDSAAKTQDNFDRSLLRCLESSADAELDAAHFGVWMVRVCTSEEQYRFREVPELALRSVPRSVRHSRSRLGGGPGRNQ